MFDYDDSQMPSQPQLPRLPIMPKPKPPQAIISGGTVAPTQPILPKANLPTAVSPAPAPVLPKAPPLRPTTPTPAMMAHAAAARPDLENDGTLGADGAIHFKGPVDLGDPASIKDAATASANEKSEQDISSMWSDVLDSHDAGKAGLFNQANADEANAGRRNAEMNAISGGGMGGAFAGGQAQVGIGGMQARQKALQDFNKQGVELKMARLDQLIKRAEASGDRNLQRELQAEADKTSLFLKQIDTQSSVNDANTLAKSINDTGGY